MTAKNAEASSADEPKQESWASFLWFCAKLVLAVLLFRTLAFSFFTIPSESMLPGLRTGDYLIAAKWPYGYNENSLPLGLPGPDERVFGNVPERGDVVVFKHPVDRFDYVKRVIGLPGDTIGMRGGTVILNGEPVPQQAAPPILLPKRRRLPPRLRKRHRHRPPKKRPPSRTSSRRRALTPSIPATPW